MLVGVVGKPNEGKTTFFDAVTLAGAEIANYPFTTVEPNKGVGYVRRPCPCQDLEVTCTPNNSVCRKGVRYAPVNLLDVAGLVPGAHQGRGLGNQFLDDLRRADLLIHVVDSAGSTDSEGNPTEPGSHDPTEDILWLEQELDLWLYGILNKDWMKMAKRAESGTAPLMSLLLDRFSGLGATEAGEADVPVEYHRLLHLPLVARWEQYRREPVRIQQDAVRHWEAVHQVISAHSLRRPDTPAQVASVPVSPRTTNPNWLTLQHVWGLDGSELPPIV